jgi:hypothetical protein
MPTTKPLKFTIKAAEGQFEDVLAIRSYRTIEEAGKATMETVAEIGKRKVRADIALAGFGPRWQRTFRADVFPKGSEPSANAAAFFHHKIGYAGIFEDGGKIQGKPLLWIPLSGTPKKIGRRRFSVENYRLRYTSKDSRLQRVDRPGKNPLLFGKAPAGMRRGRKRGVSSEQFQTQRVPLFVGVKSVDISKRFHVREILAGVAADLPNLFTAHFDPD